MQHSVVVLAGGYVLCATAFWATPRSHSGLEDILLDKTLAVLPHTAARPQGIGVKAKVIMSS